MRGGQVMTISATMNQWAVLGLIACDASYKPHQAGVLDEPLVTFQDSNPERDYLPLSVVTNAGLSATPLPSRHIQIDGWKAIKYVSGAGTGFGAVIFQSDDKTKAIVA